jgi:anhydro-N-acetylmuramic acid kinase
LKVLEDEDDPASAPLAPDDLVATVTAHTAVTVADACRAHRVRRVIAAGGGTANPVLMSMLEAQLPSVTVAPIDELGVPAGAKEAFAFALLGFLTVHNLPGNVPSVTGATRAVVLGSVVPGRKGFPTTRAIEAPPARLRIASGGES